MKIRSLLFCAFALATTVTTAEENLRSFEEINAFFEKPEPRKTAFEITGKVLSTSRLPKTGEIILCDASGRRMQFFRSFELSQPEPGDTIKADGIASISRNGEPYMRITEFKVLKHGDRPEPVCVPLSETNARRHHLLTITTGGTVIDAFPDEIDRRFMILLLKDGEMVVPVSLKLDVFGDRSDLVDATVRVTGIYRRSVGGVRKFSWPNITPRVPGDVVTVTPPPKDIFAVPPIENRLYLTSDEIIRMSKRSATGEVLATWSGDRVMLRTADGRIVKLKLAHGETLPPCGMTVVAAGQPETDLFHINLTAARWKESSARLQAGSCETAETTDAAFWSSSGRTSLNGEAYGKLITAQGIVRTLPSPDDGNFRFVLDCGNSSIYVDASSSRNAVEDLQIGCRIMVTGRCILLTDAGVRDYSSAKINGVALVIRSPADIAVLMRPSWWTLRRLTIVISLLGTILVGIYIWNRILHNLVNRRGRELYREQVAHAIAEFRTGERTRLAVELHDSLSQTLAGVACHLAVGEKNLAADPVAAKNLLATARKMLNSCRTELKQCLFDLRSDTLEEQNFSAAIRRTLDQLEGDADVSIRFNIPRRLMKDTTAHAVLCIIRELAGNAVRHGAATEVKVAGCIERGHILFSVKDNGKGFDPSACEGPAQGHFGLEGVRNRLEKLNGSLTIESAPGEGTKATATIPLPAAITQETGNS